MMSSCRPGAQRQRIQVPEKAWILVDRPHKLNKMRFHGATVPVKLQGHERDNLKARTVT